MVEHTEGKWLIHDTKYYKGTPVGYEIADRLANRKHFCNQTVNCSNQLS